jgi:hypothetical protein
LKSLLSLINDTNANARRGGASMHDKQTVAVLLMCALEFEYQLALGQVGLCNSDSSSTLAHEVMLTHAHARNFGHHYPTIGWNLEEIVVVGFPHVSGLHVLSCLVHEFLCFVPNIFDKLIRMH